MPKAMGMRRNGRQMEARRVFILISEFSAAFDRFASPLECKSAPQCTTSRDTKMPCSNASLFPLAGTVSRCPPWRCVSPISFAVAYVYRYSSQRPHLLSISAASVYRLITRQPALSVDLLARIAPSHPLATRFSLEQWRISHA